MLEQFLSQTAGSAFEWGDNDCAMMIANWWRFKHGVDPAVDLRGTYKTERGCRKVLDREGGILSVVRTRAENVGAVQVPVPEPGDIGVIRIDGVGYAAVCGPTGRWMVKSPRGLAGFRVGYVMAWRT